MIGAVFGLALLVLLVYSKDDSKRWLIKALP